ncbi:MAG: hypothetical protein D6707_07995 [Bacteroidetes bacterium]|nr:MAG: hypothetical protein D6707_07995 [Bacteroidota bacterium]
MPKKRGFVKSAAFFLFLTGSVFFVAAQDSCKAGKIQVNINLFNALIFRPYLGIEYQISPKNYFVFQPGGIFNNNTLQEKTVRILKEDHYMFSGFYAGAGWKKFDKDLNDTYLLFLLSYKYSDYFKKEWKNGIPSNEPEALATLQSSVKHQITLSVQRGKQICLGTHFYADLFYGAGLRMSFIKKYLIKEIYNNGNYLYANYTFPFTLSENRLNPILHLGIRLGFKTP